MMTIIIIDAKITATQGDRPHGGIEKEEAR
jgi:hypothetical protein